MNIRRSGQQRPLTYERYERLFIEFSERVEKVLVRCLYVLLAGLLISQLLLQFPGVRKEITRVEPLEGVPYVRQSEE
ncbi:hypothetical protein [Paenibacillus sp. UNC499MF]|uniref:hypothetical protein n=1 Tax=Paenibacillus sp. UNC499MF TaxID=1502751 RepID=UPI0008A0902B|nr:hypothetical protein [Paenibacillus sp. UNC499MF]SEG13112.1 hypothetical protein SAMN02799616_01969 [Paenibacillus sp. UNC499MF]